VNILWATFGVTVICSVLAATPLAFFDAFWVKKLNVWIKRLG
jgi:hypothetical protein